MKHRCDNCGAVYTNQTLPYNLLNTPDLNIRLDPGSVVPSGECKCGALTYLVKERKKRKLHKCKLHCSGRNECPAENNGYGCTLPLGHQGDHIACGKSGHDYHIWKGKP